MLKTEKPIIIIYGAGTYGKKLLSILNELNVPVNFFCQTKKSTLAEIDGIPILSYQDLLNLKGKNLCVFIAISDTNLSQTIKCKITNFFLDQVVIYECGAFIRQNSSSIHKSKYCLLCNSFIDDFYAGGIAEEIFEKHHIIGGGFREHVNCPSCGCSDRERWCMSILSRHTNIFLSECKVLHFAPEAGIMKRIRNNEKCDYYSCDLEAGKAMNVIDVTDIPFKDSIFDYVIINHVLEHVKNIKKAISELKRVLKPDGRLILSFPICTDQKTLEDDSIVTAKDRKKIYGQEDHVRLYGTDFLEKLYEFNLKVNVYSPKDEYDVETIKKYGFIADDILMICSNSQ